MRRLRFFVLICGGLLEALQAFAQDRRPVPDTLRRDTLRRGSNYGVESLLIQQQKQTQVDSALRRQLEAELKKTSGDQLKTRELQAQLQRLLNDDSTKKQAQLQRTNKQALIYSLLHEHLQDACNEAGIEIMSPHYQAMRDGNATAIPSDCLPKDYQAPPFNVRQKGKE